MKLYFVEQGLRLHNAVREAEVNSGAKYFPLDILMSYYNLQKKDLDDYLGKWIDRSEINLFIDSGAFSAWSHYQKIDVRRYGDWLLKNQGWIDMYANLDVKESWKDSEANINILEGMGLHPLPVYHIGEPDYIWKNMLLNYDYICLGGMAGGMQKMSVLVPLMRKYAHEAQAAGKKLHLFGIGNFPALMQVPATSADSSSYIGYRWGKVKIFDEVQMKFIQFQVADPRLIAYEHYFARLGLPSFPALLKRAGKHTGTYLRAFEYLNMKRMEEFVSAIWIVRGQTKP